jgi:hypothetical protein
MNIPIASLTNSYSDVGFEQILNKIQTPGQMAHLLALSLLTLVQIFNEAVAGRLSISYLNSS